MLIPAYLSKNVAGQLTRKYWDFIHAHEKSYHDDFENEVVALLGGYVMSCKCKGCGEKLVIVIRKGPK